MGALSSFAMLALTHHLIVQFAYRQTHFMTRELWFSGYEILGDDIQIFDKVVADKYLEICDKLGVSINVSKSIVSQQLRPVVEFAKRTSLDGVDVSAISWKMIASQDNAPGRVLVAEKVYSKGVVKNYSSALFLSTCSKFGKVNLAYPIISVYCTLFKNKEVDYRWLCERLVDLDFYDIVIGKRQLPRVSLKEFREVVKLIESKQCLWGLYSDPDKEAVVDIHYIKAMEYVLRVRLTRLSAYLVSEEFISKIQSSFEEKIFGNVEAGSWIFVVKDLHYDLIMDRYYSKLSKLLAKDTNLMRLEELMDHLDELEGERRAMELGIRADDTKRRIEIRSDIYILKSLVKVQKTPVGAWYHNQDPTM